MIGRSAAVSLILFALTTVLGACGDEEGRSISASDLPQIMLQRADVAIGEQAAPIAQSDERSSVYAQEFEVLPEQAVPGETVCVSSVLALYRDSGNARDAFKSVATSINELIVGSSAEHIVERVSTHALGDETDAFRTTSQATSFCSSYENVALDGYSFYFRDGDIIATVAVYNLESGASLPDAIRFAEAQQSKIEEFRASTP